MADLIVPLDIPDDAYTVTLDVALSGVDVTIRLRWREAASGWYLSATLPDGTSLGHGVRLCPGADVAIDLTKDGAPDGRLVCIGDVELTKRERLGTAVFLAWRETAG